MSRRIETVEHFVHAFNEFLDKEDLLTPEEIDTELREAGLDPEKVGARMQAVAEHALASSLWNWRNRAVVELEQERARIADATRTVPRDRADIIGAIRELIAQTGSKPAYAHRNLEAQTDEDLADLLTELEYLASRQQRPSKE